LQAVEALVPIRAASGEDVRVLLGVIERLISALNLAGQEIVRDRARGSCWTRCGNG
jgi:hypothetical protein